MKPFLKWAGGKYKIIDRVREKLPNGARLIEPFVGSGAVFMNTDYPEYLLADANPDLINVFQHVQSDADFTSTFHPIILTKLFVEQGEFKHEVQRC